MGGEGLLLVALPPPLLSNSPPPSPPPSHSNNFKTNYIDEPGRREGTLNNNYRTPYNRPPSVI